VADVLHELLPLAAVEAESLDDGRTLTRTQLAAAPVPRQRITVDDPKEEELNTNTIASRTTASISFLTSRRRLTTYSPRRRFPCGENGTTGHRR
jgi:hypothetical protein